MSKYLDLFKKQIKSLDSKKRLLVHACCGPCSIYPLTYLSKYFDVSVYYDNSNIYPEEEYYKRLAAIEEFILKSKLDIKLIVPGYDHKFYLRQMKNLMHLPEGSLRCFKCYGIRMNNAAKYAANNKFDYFSTIMSISRHKNSNYINELGMELEKQYDIPFLFSDFKKDDGSLKNKELNDIYNLYHQDYCGCLCSIKERNERNAKNK